MSPGKARGGEGKRGKEEPFLINARYIWSEGEKGKVGQKRGKRSEWRRRKGNQILFFSNSQSDAKKDRERESTLHKRKRKKEREG